MRETYPGFRGRSQLLTRSDFESHTEWTDSADLNSPVEARSELVGEHVVPGHVPRHEDARVGGVDVSATRAHEH